MNFIIGLGFVIAAGVLYALGYAHGHASCLSDVQRTLREYDGQ
jgi:hypothetical protein